MVRGIADRVKPPALVSAPESTAKGTLLLSDLGLTNVLQKAGVSRAALGIVLAGLVQAQLAVDREADFGGIGVLLAVVFPPADGAQTESAGSFQRPAPAAWAAKTYLGERFQEQPRVNGRERRAAGLHEKQFSAVSCQFSVGFSGFGQAGPSVGLRRGAARSAEGGRAGCRE